MVSQCASSAAPVGLRVTSAATSRSAPPRSSVSVTWPRRPSSAGLSKAEPSSANTATADATAAARMARGRGRGWTARCEPIHAPSTPAATAVARLSSAASGSRLDGHGIGIHTCDQPHSAARPTVPMPTPDHSPNASGRRSATSARATPSTTSASTTYRGKCGVVSPSTGPTASASPPRRARKKPTAPSAVPRPAQSRTATSPTPAASMISIGWSTKRNWGTPKSNSPWNVDRPMSRPPASDTARTRIIHPTSRRVAPEARLARSPSTSSTAMPTSVIDAPPMSIRCVGPQSVTSCPNRRCQRSSSGNPSSANAPQAEMSTPPSGASQPGASRIAEGPGLPSGSTMAITPAEKMPNRPARMK